MIEFINVTKSFHSKSGVVIAVKDVNLKIEKGEIFGFIGYSGAGKSTLVRCINGLEKPTKGSVIINGVNVLDLNERQLRLQRQKIGMIFQHFNLMQSRTVFDNIGLALHNSKMDINDKNKKIYELLNLVGISEKAFSYPNQLSGGQKQRVAIARALANDPTILLCDEATSALDPQATSTILQLLKELNSKLGLTVVVITHEMHVIKSICNRVAIMEAGRIEEVSEVKNLFTDPIAPISIDFVESTSNIRSVYELIKKNPSSLNLELGDTIVKMSFSGSITQEAILSSLSKIYDIDASIIFANIEVVSDEILGVLVVIMRGAKIQQALDSLKDRAIKWEVIQWNN